jgi:IAA-amino acid hydrolase
MSCADAGKRDGKSDGADGDSHALPRQLLFEESMENMILQRSRELSPRLVEIRHALHRYPELGFEEYRTATLVADTLRALGVRVETGVGKTGVVGHIGSLGPIVALRADMDALPIQELNQTEYASTIPGVMHACGHDVHIACLLGAAMLLKEAELKGQVRLLFQPSEEGMDSERKSGAMRMIDDGAFDKVEAAFCQHVDGTYPASTLACSPGYVLAAMDNFEITIRGSAAHGAQAHLGMDAVLLAAQVVSALHTVVSRRIPPLESGVISVGTIHGGTKENILADRVVLTGTIRSFNPEVRQTLVREVDRACSIAQVLGGDYHLSIREGYPALLNDPVLASFARKVASDLVGSAAVQEIRPEMGAEDFAYYTQRAPGCYLTLGTSVPGQPARQPHTPYFDVDESVLPLGAAIMAQLAIRYLEERPLEQG